MGRTDRLACRAGLPLWESQTGAARRTARRAGSVAESAGRTPDELYACGQAFWPQGPLREPEASEPPRRAACPFATRGFLATMLARGVNAHAPLAQLDRASDYESEGWRFESSGVCFFLPGFCLSRGGWTNISSSSLGRRGELATRYFFSSSTASSFCIGPRWNHSGRLPCNLRSRAMPRDKFSATSALQLAPCN